MNFISRKQKLEFNLAKLLWVCNYSYRAQKETSPRSNDKTEMVQPQYKICINKNSDKTKWVRS